MQQRITVDIDTRNIFVILFRYLQVYLYWNSYQFIIRKSCKKGYHIIIWLNKPVTNKKHFFLRWWFGDDKNRIKLDRERLKRGEPINILFYRKNDFYYKRR